MTNKTKKKKKWRKAARKAMYKATIKESIERYRTKYPVFNYRWEHVQAVVQLALKLAALTGADVEVVEAAAWLHDIKKRKAKSRHPEAGAKKARKLLRKTDFPEEKIERVAYAIECHTGMWRDDPLKNLEAQVLWDADKLTKIGLTAAFHWTGALFASDEMMTMERIVDSGREADWLEKTVASMHTEPARRAARKRLQAYDTLWDNLEAELNADDVY